MAARLVNLTQDPDVRGIVMNLHDVTDRKQIENQLVHHAFHDTLTDLANRSLLLDRLEHALNQAARTGIDPAVLYVDLDNFKAINDTLGHKAGDEVLCEVARRIEEALRAGDTLARIGGDEFVVLIEQSVDTMSDARAISERVLEELRSPFELTEHTVTLSASIGIAEASGDASADSLVRDADIAMYEAKSQGRARSVLYQPEMHHAAARRFRIDNDLYHTIEKEELRLEYQPVVSLQDERIRGVEALLRWDHPTLGPIPPETFIPIAERKGVIVAIGRWVLSTACIEAARWNQLIGDSLDLSMAVNVAASQLTSADFYGDVTDALDSSGLAPSSLVIEITETSLVYNTRHVAGALHRLRSLGIRVAIDDFGTGYSSLGYLQDMPIDILKIDRSFIDSMQLGVGPPSVVRGVIDLAHTLRLGTVAEGIETRTQLDALRRLRCDLGQGYLFSPPMQPRDVVRILESERDNLSMGPEDQRRRRGDGMRAGGAGPTL